MNIRLAKPDDLFAIQAANLQNLPENYGMKFCAPPRRPSCRSLRCRYAGMYHAITWPQISFVAEDHKGRIVGYVLAKIRMSSDEGEDDDGGSGTVTRKDDHAGKLPEVHGHVNSISVLRSYRRLGLARKLMLLSQEAMVSVYRASFVSLHVRKSNLAAIALYRDALGFRVFKVESKYYGDGEDALSMRLDMNP
ncbi:acyl-CoA N-acyltransferase [Mycena pura]|uniref:Acyl-CoA N-acyltransferase n=1 Tax=Mycena pura TaxID=153505 RepID=A0AAD6Y6K8_9AGAR|nr:acyl-CoA N-acyltransferase [Mycena pura]